LLKIMWMDVLRFRSIEKICLTVKVLVMSDITITLGIVIMTHR